MSNTVVNTMPSQQLKSFQELPGAQPKQRSAPASVPRPTPQVTTRVDRVWVQFDVAANAEPSVAHSCRSIILEWAGENFKEPWPRQAPRHRPFSHRENDASCRVVRIRKPEEDLWALQLERMSAPGRQMATSLTVASYLGHPARTRIGVEVHDRSVMSGAAIEEYPLKLINEIADRIPLLQNGKRFVRDPILVETEETMEGFLGELVNPKREMPFVVISISPEEPDKTQWVTLSRALAGLAVVWVLPLQMTYRLSDKVTKRLSAFNGAWRFYRPGFNERALQTRHPLVMWEKLSDERGRGAAAAQFQRLAAGERLRLSDDDRDKIGFDAIAGEADAAPSLMRRLAAFLRNLIWRDHGKSTAQLDSVPRSKSQGEEGATVEDEQGTEESSGAGAARGLPHELTETPPNSDSQEQAQQWTEEVERENEKLHNRVRQLTGLVRSLGGDPDAAIPFPLAWDQVADWCDQSLSEQILLTPSARRDLNKAEFSNVDLAARCLSWLGRKYRDGRLNGAAPDLRGRIEDIAEGVFNEPCGNDSFHCTWNGNKCTVDWHIKNGAGTRDPRRCLRIYYFWDEDSRKVVVASMPAHRRTALS